MHNVGKPIILDYAGGLTGEALTSMNVVSGVAHGIGERGSFNIGGWDKAPRKPEEDEERQGGRASRVDVQVLGRSFTIPEVETLLSAKGAKSLLVPTDADALFLNGLRPAPATCGDSTPLKPKDGWMSSRPRRPSSGRRHSRKSV